MKKQITKMVSAFIPIVIGMFSFTFANAQTCRANKVWACRTSNCVQECKCVNANNVTQWQANGQPCQGLPCSCVRPISARCRPRCSPFRLRENGTNSETILTGIYPNPVSQSATISFSLEQSEKVYVAIFDMTGRLVKTFADGEMQEGNHQIEWNATDEKGNTMDAGIYLLKVETGNYSETKKLSVVR